MSGDEEKVDPPRGDAAEEKDDAPAAAGTLSDPRCVWTSKGPQCALTGILAVHRTHAGSLRHTYDPAVVYHRLWAREKDPSVSVRAHASSKICMWTVSDARWCAACQYGSVYFVDVAMWDQGVRAARALHAKQKQTKSTKSPYMTCWHWEWATAAT